MLTYMKLEMEAQCNFLPACFTKEYLPKRGFFFFFASNAMIGNNVIMVSEVGLIILC